MWSRYKHAPWPAANTRSSANMRPQSGHETGPPDGGWPCAWLAAERGTKAHTGEVDAVGGGGVESSGFNAYELCTGDDEAARSGTTSDSSAADDESAVPNARSAAVAWASAACRCTRRSRRTTKLEVGKRMESSVGALACNRA